MIETNILFGNYGDNTIALLQWAYEQSIKNVYVVHVETGWAAPEWQMRVEQGQTLVNRYGFQSVTLKSPATFSELVKDRNSFPSKKFQWCAGFLKGLAFITWANQIDPNLEATVLIGSRKADSRARFDLAEWIEESEHFGKRKVWHPLLNCNDDDRNVLIHRAGFEVLNHRSLECDPCIHVSANDMACMEVSSIHRLAQLENEIQQSMFDQPVRSLIKRELKHLKRANLEPLDMGCGAVYGCGE